MIFLTMTSRLFDKWCWDTATQAKDINKQKNESGSFISYIKINSKNQRDGSEGKGTSP